MKMKLISALVLTLMLNASMAQKFEKMALTPPMGWNSWNLFACNIDEILIREMADAMVATGMKEAGYEYINLDDCWHGERDSLGFIQPNKQRFPNGMKALADYVHSKGLKIGIYSDAGWKTCGGHPGSRGHEYQDAMQYAAWGIDYLKYDWCYTDGLKAEGAYLTMREALFATGRPMVFSLCEWGTSDPWKWATPVGHLWRTTGDITHIFDGIDDHGTWQSLGILQIIDLRNNDTIRKYAGPGHWNDPDMMEVGNGMSTSEDRAHFSMWCMLAAPLISGNDLRNMSAETKTILTNKEVIAINQDSLGIQGYKHTKIDSVDVWVKPLQNNAFAVCFLNRGKNSAMVNFDWATNSFNDTFSGRKTDFTKESYSLNDLWGHKKIGATKKVLKAVLSSHDVLMLKLIKE